MAQLPVTPHEVLELLRRQPFVPLRIHMSDGRTHDIRHPELVIVGRQCLNIGLPNDLEEGVADRLEFCNLLHVVRIEELIDAA